MKQRGRLILAVVAALYLATGAPSFAGKSDDSDDLLREFAAAIEPGKLAPQMPTVTIETSPIICQKATITAIAVHAAVAMNPLPWFYKRKFPGILALAQERMADAKGMPEKEFEENLAAEKSVFATPNIKLFAVGPELTSADGEGIPIEVSCAEDGIHLTALVTRHSTIMPELRSAIEWKPSLELDMVLDQPETNVTVTWVIHATGDLETRRTVTKKTLVYQPKTTL